MTLADRKNPGKSVTFSEDQLKKPRITRACHMKKIALLLIRFYQNTWSRVTPSTCRFYPTCSHYGYEAIETYGFCKGGWMAIKRIGRCHPFHPGGYDPVPKPDDKREPVIGER